MAYHFLRNAKVVPIDSKVRNHAVNGATIEDVPFRWKVPQLIGYKMLNGTAHILKDVFGGTQPYGIVDFIDK